jgi:cell division protein FtsB
MLSGARGAVSWALLSKEVGSLEKELKILKEENAFLENKIGRLRDNNLDLDLLEEQAQNILGFADENDLIVLLPRE